MKKKRYPVYLKKNTSFNEIIKLSGRLGIGFNADESKFIEALSKLIHVKQNSSIFLDFSNVTFLYPSAINSLVTLGKYLISSRNCRITQNAPADSDVRNYFVKSGFTAMVGIMDLPYNKNVKIDETKLFKLQRFEYVNEFEIEQLISVIETELKLTLFVKTRIHDNIAELIMNVLHHSKSQLACDIIGQAYPTSHRIRYCACDAGIGIKKHIIKKYPNHTDSKTSDVIEFATQYGITGTFDNDPSKCNSGLGLDDMRKLVRCCGGSFNIMSGDGFYGEFVSFTQPTKPPNIKTIKMDFDHHFHGTLVDIMLQATPGTTIMHISDKIAKGLLRKPQDVSTIINIGEIIGPDCSERESNKNQKGGKEIRDLIIDNLKDGKNVCIDFGKVRRATPSFIDEAIGKIVLIIPIENFKERITFQNINDDVIFNRIDESIAIRAKQFRN